MAEQHHTGKKNSMSDNPNPVGTIEEELAQVQRLIVTDAALAAQNAEKVLTRAPGHVVATFWLGVARRFAGDAIGAIEALQPLTQSQPDWAAVHFEFGRACSSAGRGAEAIEALRRCIELQPAYPGAWCSLADELRAAGEEAEADAVCARRLELASQDPRMQQAETALRGERLADANKLLRQLLQEDPTNALAMHMLAAVYLRLEEFGDAGNLLSRCVELAPNYAAAQHDYALVLDKQMRRGDALKAIEQALAADPGNPDYRSVQAVFLDRVGEYDRAIEVYASLLDALPDQAKVWTSYGHVLRAAGRQADGVAAYERAIEFSPQSGEAWWSLADLKTYKFSSDKMDEIRRQLDRSELADEDRLNFEFALGKVLEDGGEYKESFEHYAEGNRLRRKVEPYDAAALTDGVKRTKALLTPAFFADRADVGSAAPDPIFIVGLPRAGSTLLEQILASHSAVEGTMELPDMLGIVRELGERDSGAGRWQYPEVLANLKSEEFRALGERYLESTRIYRKTSRPMFIDKMPNNFANVGLIQLLLPNAKIVDARRHPVASCFSIYKQLFARGQLFANSLDDLGHTYRDYVELMAHFDKVLPGRVHRVFYERLVDDSEAEIRGLLEYCGLRFEESCLRFHETDRAVRTASSAQVRQPIYREGINHWRHFEPWLDPLQKALGPVLDAYPAVPAFDP
ncbi:MAG: tetratricopeptide repeat-containing sulfotransferase family protein [Woeseiaceae bacterium]